MSDAASETRFRIGAGHSGTLLIVSSVFYEVTGSPGWSLLPFRAHPVSKLLSSRAVHIVRAFATDPIPEKRSFHRYKCNSRYRERNGSNKPSLFLDSLKPFRRVSVSVPAFVPPAFTSPGFPFSSLSLSLSVPFFLSFPQDLSGRA